MVGPGHCPMISKYGPSLSKAVGPVDPSFLVVKKSSFNKKYSSYSESTNSTKQKVHVGSRYSKTCLKQPLKKDKTKIFMWYDAIFDLQGKFFLFVNLYKVMYIKSKLCRRCLTSHLNRTYDGHAQKCRCIYNHSPTNIKWGDC